MILRRRYRRRRHRSRGGISLGGNNIIWLGLAAVVAYGIWRSGALKRIIGGAAAAGGGGAAGAPDLPDCPNIPSTGRGCDSDPAAYQRETGQPCPSGCD